METKIHLFAAYRKHIRKPQNKHMLTIKRMETVNGKISGTDICMTANFIQPKESNYRYKFTLFNDLRNNVTRSIVSNQHRCTICWVT